MFTVLYRDDQGAETLYAAKSVARRASPDENSIPPMGPVEVFLEDEAMVPGGRVTLTPGARCANGFDPMVFVMNKHGSTVATYRL